MKALVFAGTTEGREAALMLARTGISVTAFTATDYGHEVLDGAADGLQNLAVESGRLSEEQIRELLMGETPDTLVIDATHPYAAQVTANIRRACMDAQKRYIRIVRKSTFKSAADAGFAADPEYAAASGEAGQSGVTVLADAQALCEWANREENIKKKILLTTGSKDLRIYTAIDSYRDRVWPRILPDMDSLRIATELGYKKSNIICMQGPFSTEMNIAMIKSVGAQVLVTKDTGKTGGFDSKLEAALSSGIESVVIGRPSDQEAMQADSEGMSLEELQRHIDENFPSLRENSSSDELVRMADFPRFSLFVSLSGKTVTVVGAGKIASRRIKVLLEYGARIRVIAPQICAEIRALPGFLEIIEREYERRDVSGSFMVIAATDSREVNQKAGADAKAEGIHVSVADSREECSFYFPAVIRKGGISIGLVSDGSDHAAAARTAGELREYLQANQ